MSHEMPVGSVGSLLPFRNEMGATSLLNQLASQEKSINYLCIIILILVYTQREMGAIWRAKYGAPTVQWARCPHFGPKWGQRAY